MTAERDWDADVKAMHQQDEMRADTLLDLLVTLPPKREARRQIVALLELARTQGAGDPHLAREMARRRAGALPDEVA